MVFTVGWYIADQDVLNNKKKTSPSIYIPHFLRKSEQNNELGENVDFYWPIETGGITAVFLLLGGPSSASSFFTTTGEDSWCPLEPSDDTALAGRFEAI